MLDRERARDRQDDRRALQQPGERDGLFHRHAEALGGGGGDLLARRGRARSPVASLQDDRIYQAGADVSGRMRMMAKPGRPWSGSTCAWDWSPRRGRRTRATRRTRPTMGGRRPHRRRRPGDRATSMLVYAAGGARPVGGGGRGLSWTRRGPFDRRVRLSAGGGGGARRAPRAHLGRWNDGFCFSVRRARAPAGARTEIAMEDEPYYDWLA